MRGRVPIPTWLSLIYMGFFAAAAWYAGAVAGSDVLKTIGVFLAAFTFYNAVQWARARAKDLGRDRLD